MERESRIAFEGLMVLVAVIAVILSIAHYNTVQKCGEMCAESGVQSVGPITCICK